jgi:hypothetical protein
MLAFNFAKMNDAFALTLLALLTLLTLSAHFSDIVLTLFCLVLEVVNASRAANVDRKMTV